MVIILYLRFTRLNVYLHLQISNSNYTVITHNTLWNLIRCHGNPKPSIKEERQFRQTVHFYVFTLSTIWNSIAGCKSAAIRSLFISYEYVCVTILFLLKSFVKYFKIKYIVLAYIWLVNLFLMYWLSLYKHCINVSLTANKLLNLICSLFITCHLRKVSSMKYTVPLFFLPAIGFIVYCGPGPFWKL